MMAVFLVIPAVYSTGCERKQNRPSNWDDVDPQSSEAHAVSRSVFAYPGSDNEIRLNLMDRNRKSVGVDVPVRIGCRGATARGAGERTRKGYYRFWVEPDLDAVRSVCAISLGSVLFPKAVAFDVVAPCAGSPREKDRDRSLTLAKRFAPVFYQDTGRQPNADFFAAVDFDGNLDPVDNRDNIDAFPLVGTVYYSAVETRTHIFLVYAVFHPVNYGLFLDGTTETTENSMTGLLVVVDRAHIAEAPVYVETYMEGQFMQYTGRGKVLPRTEDVDGQATFEDGTHVRVFLESGRHGCLINAETVIGEYTGEPGGDFPGGDGVIYRETDEPAEPEGPNDRNAGYRLAPILDTLWKVQDFVGRRSVYATTFRMATGCEYPERFVASSPGQRGGRPPWAWDDLDDEGVRAGEWFFWPAWAAASHVTMPEPFDVQYTYNPFLGID